MGDGVDRTALVETLVDRRRRLRLELDQLTDPPPEGAAVAFGKRIGEGTTEAVERLATTATARSIAASITEIDRVLAKLSEGTYGWCDRCGAEIAPERLEARPASVLCVSCASAGGSAVRPTT